MPYWGVSKDKLWDNVFSLGLCQIISFKRFKFRILRGVESAESHICTKWSKDKNRHTNSDRHYT